MAELSRQPLAPPRVLRDRDWLGRLGARSMSRRFLYSASFALLNQRAVILRGYLVLNLSNIEAVMVDLDGTMVDTLGDFRVALNAMLADLPPPYGAQQVDQATVARLVGKGSEHLIKSVLALFDLTSVEALYPPAWASYQHHYARVNGQFSALYPGVLQGLQQLTARGLRLACLTNKPTAFATALLAAKGLAPFFEMTVGGDAFERKKPDPLPLIKTCEALGVRTERTLMVGDSRNDAQAARAAGCPVVLVTYGYNHGEPIRAVDADGFVDALDQITTALADCPRGDFKR